MSEGSNCSASSTTLDIVHLFYYSHPSGHEWRRQSHPDPVVLPGKSHGRRSLVGCSPWGREELDMTERLPFHFSVLCIGEGNGNPLQCSCLENPGDGVAQSRTRLKWLSSSSSGPEMVPHCSIGISSNFKSNSQETSWDGFRTHWVWLSALEGSE